MIIAGLDTDFRGEPFGPIPTLMAKAEIVDKLHAICMVCGESASRTQRLVNGQPAHYDDSVVIVWLYCSQGLTILEDSETTYARLSRIPG